MERELRSDLTTKAQAKAVQVFGKNLSSLLLQAPLPGKVVLGVDPAFRTGCKLAVVDATGRIVDTGAVFPHPPAPEDKRRRAHSDLAALMRRHAVEVVAIGNGTASRETEQFVALVCKELQAGGLEVGWVVVNEAGASVYSASELAAEELPGMDVSLRGAVSIARRLQDPLSELVKIDPQHIGVGLYQHDLKEKRLAQELDSVVETAVNSVGVDANVASPALLARVAGVGPALAKRIVEHRDQSGPYKDRAALMKVKGLGKKAFEQCAGFMRVSCGACALDNTPIHPESYAVVERLVDRYVGGGKRGKKAVTPEILAALGPKVPDMEQHMPSLCEELGVGEPTLRDIVAALKAPGRDVRGLPRDGLVRKGARSMSEVRQGVELSGVVRNVVAFGAFVDLGVGRDALLHKSGMRARDGGRVADPHSVVSVGTEVMVRVTEVDEQRGRLSVVMVHDSPV